MSLPLELSLLYVFPDVAAAAATCKALDAACKTTLPWTALFRRRFPCLAALPQFTRAPTDARSLVKSLVRAIPPPPRPQRRGRSREPLFPVPRDSQGRVVPLADDVIIAVQLVGRGGSVLTHEPLSRGHARFVEVEGLDALPPNSDTMLPITITTSVARDAPTDVSRRKTLHEEVFVVAGDTVWKLSNRDTMPINLTFVDRHEINLAMATEWGHEFSFVSTLMTVKRVPTRFLLWFDPDALIYPGRPPLSQDWHTLLCELLALARPVRFKTHPAAL